ncbi:putative phospholipase B-like 2 [Rhipicephalus sanguineus]|uniref:putative phospholipase B-like 2 n=1 Tax=Rhipicephalus sanguineus TaxID=34632 RepID=UPI00189349D5|nr:putative phospholipase B-like 2 [Rhipicephalus sanguineus]
MRHSQTVARSFLQLCCLVVILVTCEATECKWAYVAPELGTSRLLLYDGKPPSVSHNGGATLLAPVAWANFRDDIQNSGWAYLEVESSPNATDEVQAYAAGALEAYLTRYLMEAQWENMFAHYCDNQTKFCAKLYDFLQKNLEYSYHNEKRLRASDPYWNVVHLQMRQLSGLSDAFENITLDTSRELTNVTRALFFSLVGDFLDLEAALNRPDDFLSLNLVPACSALVKVVGDNKDLYVGHDAWFLYKSMLRIQKKYTFPWHYAPDATGLDGVIPGHTITMSSYAGKLVSLDDFYLTSAGLAVTETSIENSNPDLWQLLDPEAAPLTWVRAMVATRLATSGREWVDIFAMKNSGTYNNQWMIVDYKLFKPGTAIVNDTLWILEQMPGIMRQGDVSDVLRKQSYWPSYNVAYFDDIFVISGQTALVEQYGDYYSYDKAPRANIFRRDHGRVTDPASMTGLMRYNDYTNDPFSSCNCTPPYNPVYAISSRYDLLDPHGKYDVPRMYRRPVGGIDMKFTTYDKFKRLQFIAISGPTGNPLPTFEWSTSGFNDSHVGHPDRWEFGPVENVWGSCS